MPNDQCTSVYSGSKVGEMHFTLSEDLAKKSDLSLTKKAKLDPKAALRIPRTHRVNTQDTSKQYLSAFSEAANGGELEAEGRVTRRADFQPSDSAAYMKLKQ